MKVDSTHFPAGAYPSSNVLPSPGNNDFTLTLDIARKSAIGEASVAVPKTPQQELTEYLKKSPVEHMRDAILKRHGLTEDDLAAMPPEERTAMEATITREMKEMLQKGEGNAQSEGQALLAMVAFASDGKKISMEKGNESMPDFPRLNGV